MIYDEEFETLPREALEALQLKRLPTISKRLRIYISFLSPRRRI